MNRNNFTKFETDVITMLLAGDHPVLAAVRDQFAVAEIDSRKYTGVGYYLNFNLPTSHPKLHELLPIKKYFLLGDVDVMLGEEKIWGTVILWIEDGRISSLECVTYDEWPDEGFSYEISYFDGKRDIEKLQEEWKKKDS
jgi:hypothetical protein